MNLVSIDFDHVGTTGKVLPHNLLRLRKISLSKCLHDCAVFLVGEFVIAFRTAALRKLAMESRDVTLRGSTQQLFVPPTFYQRYMKSQVSFARAGIISLLDHSAEVLADFFQPRNLFLGDLLTCKA